jgi:hypothetical protein
LQTCSRRFLAVASCDHCSGSGLTANRKNQPNASGLYPAFNISSCSTRPALCYRPLLTLAPSPCGLECDFAWAPDAAPTGQTSEVVKERVCFTPSISGVNKKHDAQSACKSIECSQCTGGCHKHCATKLCCGTRTRFPRNSADSPRSRMLSGIVQIWPKTLLRKHSPEIRERPWVALPLLRIHLLHQHRRLVGIEVAIS